MAGVPRWVEYWRDFSTHHPPDFGHGDQAISYGLRAAPLVQRRSWTAFLSCRAPIRN